MLMLSELMTSWMRTSQVTEFVHSLTLPRIAEWLCSSMMPGAMCLPVASTTTAFLGATRFLPMAETLPPFTSTSVLARMPCGPDVHTVAFLTSSVAGCAGFAMRHASELPITTGTGTGASGFFAGFSSFFTALPVTSWEPTFATESVPFTASLRAVRSKSSAGSLPRCIVNRMRSASSRTLVAWMVSAPTTSFTLVSLSALTVSACGPWPQSMLQSPLGLVSSLEVS
jgi:hypothetical protein